MKKNLVNFYFIIHYKLKRFVAKVFLLIKVSPKKQKFDICTNLSEDLTIRYTLNGYRHFRDYYSNAEWETWNFLAQNINSSGAIIDIGANIGQFSLVASKILESRNETPPPRIICFEPIKSNYELMYGNFKANKLNLELYNFAIGMIPEQKSLSIHEVYGRLKTTNIFKIESLDSLICELKLDSVQLLKIDTDGFELEIIRGAKKFLEIYKPKILIELNLDVAKKLGIDLSVIEMELTSIGYVKEAIFDNENALFISTPQFVS
jgi:FkbM family methyltransferase